MKRRDFVKTGSLVVLGAGLPLKPEMGTPNSPPDARVIEVFHPGAVFEKRKIAQPAVNDMLKKGLEALAGPENPLRKFIDPGDRVGLKINTLGRPLLFTHHELILACVDELVKMGVKENNIIVWDRFESHMKDSRFEFNTSGSGVRCFATENASDSMRLDEKVSYTSDQDAADKRKDQYGKNSPISSIFTQDCDKIINLAILKDHSLSGVTLCLKNLAYGISTNNGRFHGPEYISRFISDFCTLSLVKSKVVLHVIDGLEACFDGGPVPRNQRSLFSPGKLWIGTDPVALDAVGYEAINKQRITKGLPPLERTGRPIDHIEMAAKRGLGINDLNRIKIEKVALG